MDVSIIETSGLGDRSYLITHGDTAVVIDPQRDIDRVLDLVADHGVQITHVLETHIHNDYLTGGLELARTTGAVYVVPAGDDVDYQRHAVTDGDTIDAGPIQLRVLHTPGHTHHHVSYVLQDAAGTVHGVFTGGSMLHGTTGRTDLLGSDQTETLSHAQFHSVRRLAAELPDTTAVYPTHGFGSFCSSSPATGDSSTIAEQRTTNPALTQDEQTYVEELIAGLSEYPTYYAHMGVINSRGPAPVDLSLPTPVDPQELRRRIDAGDWVIDLRNRTAFAAGHLAGTLGFELSGSFVAYLGWLYTWGAPLTLIGDDHDQILEARRELARIGVDNLTGSATGDVHTLAHDTPLRSYRVADFAALATEIDNPNITVLDVRRADEYDNGHIPNALNIALHELPGRVGDVPTGEVWVHCASGYRSSIAASLIDQPDRAVVLIDDKYTEAQNLNLTT
ncbi:MULTISPECIES: MBL fold metallo-hydrolase [Mycobacteriaceae]|jgi:glyoxylase-like metal-dependent hydrolase (beta-lactamase superfamily II)/rhodanese-related sulfurtransferase|uniref:MBL fold metallo-hydrolase n=1 Tax=Mycolicibacterium sediminis TaxID=1286180 RepID=A0A7I7QJV8_9MYCO|nr:MULTISPECIES: MBL fold metallo-hydrolase [Mycobacteriaceae]MBJ7386682.1 MBL fold metallo-hydrolase [Mycolicibacterium sp.]BBY26337.1 MBL fold metallo-hydrolase [Mycolicibacterium sediminis]